MRAAGRGEKDDVGFGEVALGGGKLPSELVDPVDCGEGAYALELFCCIRYIHCCFYQRQVRPTFCSL